MEQLRHWITGATGFVGSHFVYWALKHGDAQIMAIVRPVAGEHGHGRLMTVLESVAASYREAFDREKAARRIQVVHGDITERVCGVDLTTVPAAFRSGSNIFWHIAASLNFEDKHAAQIRLQNVDGTRNALALAQQLAVGRFVYVSTAYSCGKCTGDVPEQLHDLDRVFNNVYEQTKCEAEHVVADWSTRTGRAASIVRPSIVVGPKATHLPGGSDTGLYGFTREVYRLRRTLHAAKQRLVMCGDAEANVNLIAVEDVASELLRLEKAQFSGGMVHHVTSSQHPSVERVLRVVGEQCGVGAIDTVVKRAHAASPVEQAIDRRSVFYSGYLRDEKRFVRRSGPMLSVSDDDLEQYVRAYVRTRRNETADTVFKRELVHAADGHPLITYSTGPTHAPTLLLCNAYGVPADVWVPLANVLKTEFHLITWELRNTDDTGLLENGPDAHVSDLRRIMKHYGVARGHVIGWCTGADVALRFAELYPGRVDGAVSISGALNGAFASETPFQRNLRKLVQQAANNLGHARLYHQILFGQQRAHYGTLSRASEHDDHTMLSSMLGALDPALLYLTSAPFRNASSLHRYARTMREHYRHAETRGLPDVRSEVLLIAGARDDVAHPEASRIAASGLSQSTLLELPDADHFALFTDARVAHAISDFVQGSCRRKLCERARGVAA